MPHRPYRLTAVLSAAAILVPAVVGTLPAPPSARAALPVSPVTRTTTPRTADTVLAAMSLEQRVGQLFMVGTPATSTSSATLAQIGRFHVGNVMLTGRSYAGTRGPARVAAKMQARTTKAATSGVRLLVSTDQEGGNVQVLRGRGISAIPTALRQGRYSTTRLRSAARTWARQLRAAGVNMNLAPVLDTVPGPAARRNPPIGVYKREYGYTTARVASHGTAFAAGMEAQGVVPTIKHFPGLGRVTANTDTARRVTDRTTRRGDPYLTPFRHAIRAGHAPFVMMATAYYTRMDKKNPAAFSPFIINTVLRHDLGFGGAVISDDLASARQVSGWSYGARAVKFLSAGGSVVLAVNPGALPAMYRAVLARAKTHAGFRAKVNRAALLVLRVKERRHLLGG